MVVRLLGDSDEVDLEHRILCGIMLLVALLGVVSTVENAAIGNPLSMVLTTTACALGGLVAYLSVRKTRRWRVAATPIFLFFAGLLAYCWITQEGSHGTIGFDFFLLVVYALVFFRGLGKVLSLLLTAATIAALLLTEHFFPSVIVP